MERVGWEGLYSRTQYVLHMGWGGRRVMVSAWCWGLVEGTENES